MEGVRIMKDVMRILILEDMPADAEMIENELREAGLVFTAKRVTNENGFIRALKEFAPTIILSDYDLPQYNGAWALAEAKTTCPEVPFILVTGAISEDRAIDMFASGAKDYVMKSRLNRLAPAIQNALKGAQKNEAPEETEVEQSPGKPAARNEKISDKLPAEVKQQRKTQRELRQKEHFLAQAQHIAQTGSWEWNVKTSEVIWSDEMFRIFDIKPQFPAPVTILNFIHPDDRESFSQAIRQIAQAGTPINIDCRIILTDGAIRVLHLEAAVTDFDKSGKASMIVGTSQLINEQKLAEKALLESERRLYLAIRTARMITWTWDPVSGKIRCIGEFTEIFGRPPVTNAAETYALIHPDDRESYHTTMEKFASEGGMFTHEFRVIRPDTGAVIWVEERAEMQMDQDSPVRNFHGVVIDITERKQAEEIIKKYARKLEQANKELESFSYSVSHDLRAPLRAIEGFARILTRNLGKELTEEVRHNLNVILANTKKMGQLIDDLLAFSRLGRQAMKMEKIDMELVARDVWNELAVIYPNKQMTINIGHLAFCYGDEKLIRQVFINLLSNAIKYTNDTQSAIIEVGSKDEIDEVIYYVKDNGVGFDMQFAHKLFGIFQRLHSEDEFEGTGIGLPIVKRIIERHGGRVWADGKVNKGAIFYFALNKNSAPLNFI
jgi:PAS domain S-box-containing protein